MIFVQVFEFDHDEVERSTQTTESTLYNTDTTHDIRGRVRHTCRLSGEPKRLR